MELQLQEGNSAVMSFDEGFSFLGEDSGPRYPTPEGTLQTEPGRKTLMVARSGGKVRLSKGRVIVESKDKVQLVSVPQSLVSRIVCFGPVGVSAGIRDWALRSDIHVVYLSRTGNYLGQLLAGGAKQRAARVRAQLALTEERRIELARSIVTAKVNKQIVLLRRYVRDENRDDLVPKIEFMKSLRGQLPQYVTSEGLMGVEGAAAKTYYEGLCLLLPVECGFSGRNRRPPRDIVNAALSYLYALLLAECVGALVAAGLDPAFGCLHSESRGAPALGLDLMEEFRPYVVNLVVVHAARKGTLTVADQEPDQDKPGVWLTKAAKQRLVDAYELRMLQLTSGALPGFGGSIRAHIHRQAKRLANAIHSGADEFTGLSWR